MIPARTSLKKLWETLASNPQETGISRLDKGWARPSALLVRNKPM